MSETKTIGLALIAAAAIAVPVLFAQPAVTLADAGDYRYRTVLATETTAEKNQRLASEAARQSARVGASDAQPAAAVERYEPPVRNHRFNFDVPLEDEQHYRE